MPIATEGSAPMITTNRMAPRVSPNHRIARGSHAIEGSDCNPTMSPPRLRCTNVDAPIMSPRIVPATMANPNPRPRRTRLLPTASGMVPLETLARSESHTLTGAGSTTWL